MREILFRGKRVDNGEWIYGDLLTPTDIMCVWEISENTGMGDRYEIDPETVGQYTGLTDKNGTKIFEGDILGRDEFYSEYDKKYYGILIVKYGRIGHIEPCLTGFYCLNFWATSIFNYEKPEKGDYGEFFELDSINLQEIQVIGNVYDNKDLLKEKQNG